MRRTRRTLLLLVALLAIGAAILWALPIRYVTDLRVEEVRLVAGDVQPQAAQAASRPRRRIAVAFSTPSDLADLRRSSGLGFVVARLSDCAGKRGAATEVVNQGAEYLADRDRVHALPMRAGRHRHLALFDDALTRPVDHGFREQPPMGSPGGLCFSLGGSAMWFGYLGSATIPLDEALPAVAPS